MWLALTPLVFLLPILNLRVFPFVAPNEEPKWAALVLCGLAMGLLFAASIWRDRGLRPGFSWPAAGLSLFFVILFVGVWIGPNTVEGLIRFAFWLASLGVWLVAVWAWRANPAWRDWLAWAVTVAAAVFSLRYWWGYVIDYGKPGYNVSVLFSPIGHVNFTGDVLVMLVPMLMWLLLFFTHPVARVLNWFSVFTTVTVLLVAASRGALGGMVLGLVAMLAALAPHLARLRAGIPPFPKGWMPAFWLGSALITAAAVNAMLPYHYRDLVRVSATLGAAAEVPEQVTLTPGAPQPPLAEFWAKTSPILTTRTPMYASALAMALDAPWLGQGTGNFYIVYPDWSNRFPDFRDPLSNDRTFTTNPHNVVLQIATQNGFPATVLFLALLATFWLRLVVAVWRRGDAWHAAGLMALTAAIFDAMFNHVFFNPASMFTFALLGGAWWASLEPMRAAHLSLPSPKVAAALIGLATVALSIWPLRWVASEWHVGRAMAMARAPQLAAAEYRRAYALDPYNFRAVFGMMSTAYMQRRFDEALRYGLEFQRIYPFNPPALNLLGAIYLMKGDLHRAEATFREALRVLPGYEMAEQNLKRVLALKRPRAPAPDYLRKRR